MNVPSRNVSLSIWKFQLQMTDIQEVRMPKAAQILAAQIHGDAINLWAIVDTGAPSEARTIAIYGIGHSIFEASAHLYIDTVQQSGGALIWHIFEVYQ